ncbi:MAG: SUMF1/EgtB/PvdO family nonheme iron enzyme [Saprospiraceae bacterium]
MPKQALRQLVATACADEALSQLLEILAAAPKYSKVYNAMTLLSGQWQELDQNLRLNLLSFKEASTDRARINAAVLAYIDELPDEIASPKSAASATEVLLRQNIQTIAADTSWEYDLFFSFSSKDLEAARHFCHVLRGHGMRVFFSADDLRHRGGHNFGNLIQQALQRSRNFLLFCSPNAMDSEWVELEHDTFFQNYHLPNKHTRGFFIAEGPDFRYDLVPAFYRRSQRIQDPEALLHAFAASLPADSTAVALAKSEASQPVEPRQNDKKESKPLVPKANPADEVSWKIACKNNTVAAYQGYLDKWKHGIHDAEAEQKIEELNNDQDLWEYLNTHSSPESLEGNLLDYLEAFSEGLHAKEARRHIGTFEQMRAAEAAEIKRKEDEANRKKEAFQNKSEKQKAAHKKRREEKAAAAEAMAAKEAERLENERRAREAAAAEAMAARDVARPKNGQIIRDIPEEPEMVFVEGGRFIMGSNEDESSKPLHPVTVPSFWMGKYPVTFDEYDSFCTHSGYPKPGDEGWGRGTRPVINVTWEDAQEYCRWLSERTSRRYRLPSEAEWEFAARGGTRSTEYNFSGGNKLEEVGWYDENSGDKTHPVGEKKANELNLHDMNGNVCEWCRDDGHDNYDGAPSDGSAWGNDDDMLKVMRGGSWQDSHYTCAVSSRSDYVPMCWSSVIGFRLARDN